MPRLVRPPTPLLGCRQRCCPTRAVGFLVRAEPSGAAKTAHSPAGGVDNHTWPFPPPGQVPVGLGLSGRDHPECDACNQEQVCCFSAVSLPIFKCNLALLLVSSGFRDGTGCQSTVFIKSTRRQFWWVNSARFGDVDNRREAYENVTWLVD